jgi:hypothetical protein
MSQLFNISFNNNFGARKFVYTPQNQHFAWRIDNELLFRIFEFTSNDVSALWLFGLYAEDFQLDVHTFSHKKPNVQPHSKHHQTILDSWFCVDELTELANEKQLFSVFDVKSLRADLVKIYRSKSWRITKPIRIAIHHLRRILSRLQLNHSNPK